MTLHPLVHNADTRCPDCGNGDAIVRVNGNAISSVCTRCRRVDVGPMLDDDELAMISPEIEGDLLELESARVGGAAALVTTTPHPPHAFLADAFDRSLESFALQVELRMPVPPR